MERLREVKIPEIFACGLAVGLIRNKLSKFANLRITIEEFNKNSIYTFNNFEISFFRTNHSIPDSFGIAVKTRLGYIVNTGDFKFDLTPIGPINFFNVSIFPSAIQYIKPFKPKLLNAFSLTIPVSN